MTYRSVFVRDNGGFTFGLDAVTPVMFEFTPRADVSNQKGVYLSWSLPPELIRSDDAQHFIRMNNARLFMTLKNLKHVLKVYMRD